MPVGRARRAIAGLAIAWVLGAPAAGRADVVELTNGQRIVGTITDVTDAGVRIEVEGREVQIRQADVRSIAFESARSTPPTPGPPTAAPAPAAPPPPAAAEAAVRPGLTPADPRLPSVAAALAALERLQAATAAPLAPDEYAARVDEARRAATPAFGDAAVPDEILRPLGAAIRYHAFAALTRGDPTARAWDPLVADCRPLAQLAARETSRTSIDPKDPAVIRALTTPEAARALRACAGEQIAEAERQARGRR